MKLDPYYVLKCGDVYLGPGQTAEVMRTVDSPMEALHIFESDVRLWLAVFPNFQPKLLASEAARYPAWEEQYGVMMAKLDLECAAAGD